MMYQPPFADDFDLRSIDVRDSCLFRSQDSSMTLNSLKATSALILDNDSEEDQDLSANVLVDQQSQGFNPSDFLDMEGVDIVSTASSDEEPKASNEIDPQESTLFPRNIVIDNIEELEAAFEPLFNLAGDSFLVEPVPVVATKSVPVALKSSSSSFSKKRKTTRKKRAATTTTRKDATSTKKKTKVATKSTKTTVQKNQRKRERKDYDAPEGQRTYVQLRSIDVGMGRGGEMNRHDGNLLFHDAKRRLQPLYAQASKADCTLIAQQLVLDVRAWGGRFLKKDKSGWYVVHNHTARTKCSQALRENYTAEERAEKRRRYRENKRRQEADSCSSDEE